MMATGADPIDLQTLLAPPPPARALAAGANPEDQERLAKFVDARNRVAHHVQRNLDALQIAMAFRWKIYLQLTSILVSVAAAAFMAAILFRPADWADWATWLGRLLLVGVLGGFLSTVVRDLLTA